MGATGTELLHFPSGKTAFSDSRGIKSGNIGAPSGGSPGPDSIIDDDLREVVAAWPDLPTDIRIDIVAMVRAGGDR
jgi:hypothetical protein